MVVGRKRLGGHEIGGRGRRDLARGWPWWVRCASVLTLALACGDQKAARWPGGAGSKMDAATNAAAADAADLDTDGTGAVEADAGTDLNLGGLGSGCPEIPTARPASTPLWDAVEELKSPQAWYATPAAAYVAENVLYYQNESGGWPKNIDMSYRFGVDATGVAKNDRSLIDNGATTTQIRYLAFMLGSWPSCQRFSDAFAAGMKYLFAAQYPTNGGWPQVWPVEPSSYSRRITYNDNAMIHVLEIMRDVVYGAPLFKFVSQEVRDQASVALDAGVDCILKTQIVVDGKKTAWCAQHDEVTLLPAGARAYELPSESGKEGAQVLAFLLTLDLARASVPRQDIIDAVEGAVSFYDSVKILGYHYVQGANAAGEMDSWIVAAAGAPPLWARFHDLTPPFAPFFSDRDGVKVYALVDVGVERRGGYAWYVTDPRSILGATYPGWVSKWKIARNVLIAPADPAAAISAP